ncbi:hypothetical protein OE88DRAFT_1668464, partial [Heliocybe sulcata]
MSSPARDGPEDPQQHDSPSSQDLQTPMTMQSVAYPGMPMHMYPFPTSMVPSQPLRTKRRQVKNACTNCQKACKKCDDARPCLRCVKYGIAEECIDSQRKERKKGIKRGPYKKRDGKGSSTSDRADSPSTSAPIQPTIPPGIPPTQMSYMPLPYSPAFYSHPGVHPKAGDAPAYFPPFYFAAPVPQPQDGEQGYPMAPQFFPATILPYGPYMMPTRMDGQVPVPAGPFAAYPGTPIYPRPASHGGQADGSSAGSRAGEGG